jgi:hypothetical protein
MTKHDSKQSPTPRQGIRVLSRAELARAGGGVMSRPQMCNLARDTGNDILMNRWC